MKNVVLALFLGISGIVVSVPAAHADFDSALSAFREQRYTEAAVEFKKCNTAKAKFYLSLMYSMGWGVPQNKEESVALMRSAKQQELAETQPVQVAGRQ
ncbi:hypothetical protein GMLC_32700 [Geomonas limicola]|uniref:Lipoprotein n=1 Tax=Geomonas limicola TaxID=2740186 RepID=A0A6V8NB16_9BACT|nr:sel1 repeat family protein [Geomonas limicola]GFO69691.1 hypothetical protein GMLC_32700 [Geomonas limicola]